MVVEVVVVVAVVVVQWPRIHVCLVRFISIVAFSLII